MGSRRHPDLSAYFFGDKAEFLARQVLFLSDDTLMSATIWQLGEAKSRFSEVVERAIKDGAQTVTKDGRPAVVIVSVEEYERRIAPGKSLIDALRQCPEDLTKLVGAQNVDKCQFYPTNVSP